METESGNIMQAVTADGKTVPITFNPETGQYYLEGGNGEPVVVQSSTDIKPNDQQAEANPEVIISDNTNDELQTSDLSSLAAAAETHSVCFTVNLQFKYDRLTTFC